MNSTSQTIPKNSLYPQSNTQLISTLNASLEVSAVQIITYFNKSGQAKCRATAVINTHSVCRCAWVCVREFVYVHVCVVPCACVCMWYSFMFAHVFTIPITFHPSCRSDLASWVIPLQVWRTFLAFLIMQVCWWQILYIFVYLIPKIYFPPHFFFMILELQVEFLVETFVLVFFFQQFEHFVPIFSGFHFFLMRTPDGFYFCFSLCNAFLFFSGFHRFSWFLTCNISVMMCPGEVFFLLILLGVFLSFTGVYVNVFSKCGKFLTIVSSNTSSSPVSLSETLITDWNIDMVPQVSETTYHYQKASAFRFFYFFEV